MRKSIYNPFQFLFFICLLFTACSKKDVFEPPHNPGPIDKPETPGPVQKGTVFFKALIDLTGQPYHNSNLNAIISIKKLNGEAVVAQKKLILDLSSGVKTETIELPEGDYKLSCFRMEYGNVYTHFATPFAGSPKASGVQKPLEMDFKVTKNVATEIPVEVLRIQTSDKPQHFGYSSGAFDGGQEDASPFIKIKLKAVMQIGAVTYDSIPASLRLTTWNTKGEMTTTYGSLKAGVNEIQLLKEGTKFELLVSKWGTNDAITINRQDVDENTVYILGGGKEAKKLRSETVYKIIDGKDVAGTKTNYFYDHNGKLLKIDYWMKKTDGTSFFSMADWFVYEGDRLSKIKRVNVQDNTVLKETTFTYNAQGKITNMVEKENGLNTNAVVAYLPSHQNIGITYSLPSGHTLNYNMDFDRGNLVYATASNSNGSYEQGRYSHDHGINPYIHMNWPTFFLSNSSKNNVTSQQKEYNGAYPTAEPYSFFYKYDADGYPVEVIKNYRSFPTFKNVFSTKTVFTY